MVLLSAVSDRLKKYLDTIHPYRQIPCASTVLAGPGTAGEFSNQHGAGKSFQGLPANARPQPTQAQPIKAIKKDVVSDADQLRPRYQTETGTFQTDADQRTD